MHFPSSVSNFSASRIEAAKRLLPLLRRAAALLLASSAFSPFGATASFAAHDSATDSRKVGAVDFAIVIPAILRLLENKHPAELTTLTEPAAPISALQRVVLVSTLRSGFCMDLRLHPLQGGQAQVADWQVQLVALSGAAVHSGARVEAFEGGWRVCTRRAGRFELALQHAFRMQPSSASALGWPVALSLSTP
jgi:hypothetical protein